MLCNVAIKCFHSDFVKLIVMTKNIFEGKYLDKSLYSPPPFFPTHIFPSPPFLHHIPHLPPPIPHLFPFPPFGVLPCFLFTILNFDFGNFKKCHHNSSRACHSFFPQDFFNNTTNFFFC